MSHARMKTVFLHFSNYLPLSIFLIAAAVGKPGFGGISTFLVQIVLEGKNASYKRRNTVILSNFSTH